MFGKVRAWKISKQQWELRIHFKDGLQSLSDALCAGYSLENGFTEAIKDLFMLYDDKTDILLEFNYIRKQLTLNKNIEELVLDLGYRSGVEDILVFGEVLATAKRTGGDLVKVIQRTSINIGDKTDVQREIRTALSGKKLEAAIMSFMPVGIILYLWIFMPDYMKPMYEMPIGRFIMTICYLLYIVAVLLLRKIVNIEM